MSKTKLTKLLSVTKLRFKQSSHKNHLKDPTGPLTHPVGHYNISRLTGQFYDLLIIIKFTSDESRLEYQDFDILTTSILEVRRQLVGVVIGSPSFILYFIKTAALPEDKYSPLRKGVSLKGCETKGHRSCQTFT